MLVTPRLTLIPMTPELAEAELRGSEVLAAALGVPAPEVWPPELYEADDLERMRALLQDPANAGWALHYLIQLEAPRDLVGVAGYAGAPDANGVVELGYSILPHYRRRGFASEAVIALVAHALSQPRVQCVAAETYPDLAASIGVLLKTGFRPATPRTGRSTLRYELSRAS